MAGAISFGRWSCSRSSASARRSHFRKILSIAPMSIRKNSRCRQKLKRARRTCSGNKSCSVTRLDAVLRGLREARGFQSSMGKLPLCCGGRSRKLGSHQFHELLGGHGFPIEKTLTLDCLIVHGKGKGLLFPLH